MDATAHIQPSADELDRRSTHVAGGLLDRTLPKAEWTHEGHVLTCIALVRALGPADALATLRAAIPAYNEATGVANTSTSGYHDTITVYYVWAVDRLVRRVTTRRRSSPTVRSPATGRWRGGRATC